MRAYWIATFYKFVKLTDISSLQATLLKVCKAQNILGSILLAEEGINSTLAGKKENIQNVLSFLRSLKSFADLQCHYSSADFSPFRQLKVLLKKEIVALGMPNIKPYQKTGIPVDACEWDRLITAKDVLVIDTRNTYEIELGTFQHAINPNTATFKDFPHYVKNNLDPQIHRKIAMYCTGGIRCEKASAYLLEQGFENVYQLQGGILKYLERTDPKNCLWQGKCFIFDDRITL
jgi:UPF0176 protein